MAQLVPTGTEVLAGLEMGGIPVVTVLSQVTGLPAAFIRKEPKTYGTCLYAEGASLLGRKFVLVEDVVSSGGAIVDALAKLNADSLRPEVTLCVIDAGRNKKFRGRCRLRADWRIQLVGTRWSRSTPPHVPPCTGDDP